MNFRREIRDRVRLDSTARVVVSIIDVGDSPVAAGTVANVGTGRLPSAPVGLHLCGVARGSNLGPSSVPLDQVVLAVGSPLCPGRLVLALHRDVVLTQMAAASAVPSVVVDGDTDPRVLGGAGAVTDGHALGG